MDLSGKKVLFLGDSITEGVGASSQENRYTDVFARLSDAEVYTYGIGGTRIARQHKPTADKPRHDLCFLDRVEEMNAEADIVVVFGGTNDFGHGDAGLGAFEDRGEYSFYGALHSLVSRIVNRYPDATVVFMTPLHRIGENSFLRNKDCHARALLSEYVQAIREVCEYYSIPVLDLYANSGLQPSIKIIQTKYMPDGLHPSDAGARRIAERLYGFLSAL